jgi:hypothetical protein
MRAVAIYSFDDAARTICTMRLCWWKTDGRVEAKRKDCDGLQTCSHGDAAVLGEASI